MDKIANTAAPALKDAAARKAEAAKNRDHEQMQSGESLLKGCFGVKAFHLFRRFLRRLAWLLPPLSPPGKGACGTERDLGRPKKSC